MKILNLYAGIGGNRKLWGEEYEITAIEVNESIANIYRDFYPNDTVIVGDAVQYLVDNYERFDFIWASPPCPTHSRMNFLLNQKENVKINLPDMTLYQVIIFLQHWFKGKWVVENVKSYYDPLIKPMESGSHYFWSNFRIGTFENRTKKRNDKGFTLEKKQELQSIVVKDWHGYNGDKRKVLNNCVDIEHGEYILNCAVGAFKAKSVDQLTLL